MLVYWAPNLIRKSLTITSKSKTAKSSLLDANSHNPKRLQVRSGRLSLTIYIGFPTHIAYFCTSRVVLTNRDLTSLVFLFSQYLKKELEQVCFTPALTTSVPIRRFADSSWVFFRRISRFLKIKFRNVCHCQPLQKHRFAPISLRSPTVAGFPTLA